MNYLENVLNFLIYEANKKGFPFDNKVWKKEIKTDIPYQNNGYDCGIFVILFMLFISFGKTENEFRTMKDMIDRGNVRNLIAISIKRGEHFFNIYLFFVNNHQ
jgi:Ulp1 family protease